MNCMKCGREIALGQAFCKDCLADMENYPVPPGTPIQLPTPQQAPIIRRSHHTKKSRKPEEQVIRLKRILRLQFVVILLLLAGLICLGIYMYKQLSTVEQPLGPGENYITTEVVQDPPVNPN